MAKTTIHSDYIPDNAITSTKIAENSIGAREIATNAITTLYVADGSVTTVKIADDAITSAKLDTNIDIAGTLGVTGNITGTLATAAQPNITSLGTLTGLNVSGTPTFDGLTVDGVITQQTPANTDSVLTVDSTSTNVSQRLNLSANGTIQTQLYDDASQTKLLAVTNKPLLLGTNNTTAITIDTSQNVGIGTGSPAFENGKGLEIRNSSGNGAHLKLTDAASGTGGTQGFDLYMFNSQGYIENYENAPIIFRQNGGESARFDASGNLGIGTDSPSSFNQRVIAPHLVVGTGSNAAGLTLYSGTTNQSSINFAVGTTTTQQYDGGLVYVPNSSSPYLSFHVNAGAERMRIDSSGNVQIGTSNPSGNKGITIQAGTDSSASLRLKNDAHDWDVNCQTNDKFAIYSHTAGTERLVIDTSGNVGIGTTSSGYKLEINGTVGLNTSGTGALATFGANNTSDKYIRIRNSGGNYELGSTANLHYLYGQGNIPLAIYTNATEIMRINSTGEVHITGAGTPINPTIKYGGATGDIAKLRLINRSGQGSGKGGVLELGAVTDDGVTRSDVFAALHGGKDNATSGNKAGYMDFHTSNGAALDQRMRLTSNGELLVGDTNLRGTNQRGQIQVTQISSSNAAGISCISGNDEIAGTFCLYSSGTASTMISVDPDSQRASSALYVWIDGSERMSLNSSGNLYVTGSYSNSDRALKENIVTLSSQLEKVKQLNPVSFDWKEKAEDGSTQSSIGFVAQEVEELYPNLVTKPEEDTDAEQGNKTKYKTLNYPVMVSILTKAIQEQQTIIDDLKSRLDEAGL